MAVTQNTFIGDGTTVLFPFTFPYLATTDIVVEVDSVATTAYTLANATTVQLTTAPATGVDIVVKRVTNVDNLSATFFAGSAIRSQDLNDNYTQLLYKAQEDAQFVPLFNAVFPDDVSLGGNKITNLADPTAAQEAATKAYADALDTAVRTYIDGKDTAQTNARNALETHLDGETWNNTTETLHTGETWTTDNSQIATSGAIENRITAKIDDAFDNDVTVQDGLTYTSTGGTPTIGIGANSVDLDRIKDADILTGSESWFNSNNHIATTEAIDEHIDYAIENNIISDGTGVSVTSNGNGSIDLGLAVNSIDFDRIKDADKIDYAEQNAGSPTPTDDNIFTASAAVRRFDTLVQTTTPIGTDWQVGKTWIQNNNDKTISVWDGNAWLALVSGGTFTNSPKVVYVDSNAGSDAADGHRISTPKASIKAAINQINAEINVSITNGGSGYVNASYNAVPLTGGSSTGVTANITVENGAVTAVTINNTSTLENYSIDDVLSASNSDLGGSGSGLEITVGGDGDGQVVVLAAGVYQEVAPIQIKRRNVSIIGQSLRSCIIHPTVATQTNTLFEVNSGSFLQNLTFTGVKAGTGNSNTYDPALPIQQGWNVAFYQGARILKSPYIQSCTNFSDSEIDNSNLKAHNPRGGQAGDSDSAPTGGGLLIDGSAVAASSPLRSIVCDSYTHVGLNGPGILVTNNGYVQCTSSYAFFNKYHLKCRNGGQANLAASTTDFGEQGLIADGRSTTAIFTSTVSTAVTASPGAPYTNSVTIDAPTAGASWHGSATRPQSNMLMDVVDSNGTTTYEILSSIAAGSGWTVTVIRPDPNDRSENLGIQYNIAQGAAVSFYLRSMIASSGHTMEYVGSGTNYSALPENGGVPDPLDEIIELNGGKVWAVTVNDKGTFRAGDSFEINQQTGAVTLPSGAAQLSDYVKQTNITGEALIPAGSTGQRTSTPSAGNLRFNTTTTSFEGYDGAAWGDIGGGGGDFTFIETPNLLTTNKIIATNTNAAVVGPVAIQSGVTIQINNGSKLLVLD
jgi:hypothetical protein